LRRYLATVESYQQQLEALRVSDAEDYHILKIRLETDIQNLEKHLEVRHTSVVFSASTFVFSAPTAVCSAPTVVCSAPKSRALQWG